MGGRKEEGREKELEKGDFSSAPKEGAPAGGGKRQERVGKTPDF